MDSDGVTVASAGLGGRSDAAGRGAHLSTRGWEGLLGTNVEINVFDSASGS